MASRIVHQRSDGKWGWRLRSANGDIIATDGSQGYDSEADARSIADRIIGGEFSDADKKVSRRKQP